MQHAGVGAAGHDGRVAVAWRTQLPEGALQRGLHLVFMDAGSRRAHGSVKPVGRDVDGPLQQGDFRVGLDLSHQIDLGRRVLDAAQTFRAALGHAAATLDHIGDDAVQPVVAAQSVIDRVVIGQQPGQLGVQLLQGVGGVGAQRSHRAAHSGAIADPDLKGGIVRPDKKGIGGMRTGA